MKALKAGRFVRIEMLRDWRVQVKKALTHKTAKAVIVTTNIEEESTLESMLLDVLRAAEERDTPLLFALSRKKLGGVRSLI